MDEDKELYKRFVEGDISAFEELVISHKDNLIYFLKRYVRDVHTCEDIAQEAFAVIFIKKGSYNYEVSFKTYLYAISKNKALDYLRRSGRTQELSETQSSADDDELFNRVIKNEDRRLVHFTISKLSIDYQKALHLIDLEGLSYKDAGKILGKTTSQVKVLIFRARNALKKMLVKEGYTNENR